MKTQKLHDDYPLWIVFLINLMTLVVYLAGAYIMFTLSIIMGVLYMVYLLILEINLYREACRNCYYFGRSCAFGKGVVASLFFKKGNTKKFGQKKFGFKDFLSKILIVLVPIIMGIALFISRGFDILILIAIIYLFFNWFVLNPIIYGKLSCSHCKQGNLLSCSWFFQQEKNKK